MISLGETLERIQKDLDEVLPREYLNKITYLYYQSLDLYIHNSKSTYNEVFKCYNIIPHYVKWSYYRVQRNTLANDIMISKDLEEVINLYILLFKKFSEIVKEFARDLMLKKKGLKTYYDDTLLYKDLLLVKNSISAFNPEKMAVGLLNPISYESFKEDLSLMRAVYMYLDSGLVNKWEIDKLKGYKTRLWPLSKIEIYHTLENKLPKENTLKR